MKTATRGNAAEARVLAEFVRRGFDVLTPFGGGQPYDLAVDLGGAGFLRVQSKTACVSASSRRRTTSAVGSASRRISRSAAEDRLLALLPATRLLAT
jgi:hypothetical protein